LGGRFDIDSLKSKCAELKSEMNKDNFWENVDNANVINKEFSRLKKIIDNYTELKDSCETLELLQAELSLEDFEKELSNIQNKLEIMEMETHLNGEYDNLNCYLEIHPGAGGTESCDWASMILRMYERFCEKYNYKYEVIYENAGDAVRSVGENVDDLRVSLQNFINADAVDGLVYENNMLYLTASGIIVSDPVEIKGGSGGNNGTNSIVKVINNNEDNAMSITTKSSMILDFTFTSIEDDIPTGSGTCYIYVNNS